jgi:hypothetical protein
VLRQTAQWYQHYQNEGGCMREFSLNQVRDYEQEFLQICAGETGPEFAGREG